MSRIASLMANVVHLKVMPAHYQTMGMVLISMIMVDQINNGQIGRMSSNICSSFICSSFAEVVGNKCGGACGLDKKQPRSASLL